MMLEVDQRLLGIDESQVVAGQPPLLFRKSLDAIKE